MLFLIRDHGRSAAGLRAGSYAAPAAAADREEPLGSDRPGARSLRGPALLGRPAAEDRPGQTSGEGLPPL